MEAFARRRAVDRAAHRLNPLDHSRDPGRVHPTGLQSESRCATRIPGEVLLCANSREDCMDLRSIEAMPTVVFDVLFRRVNGTRSSVKRPPNATKCRNATRAIPIGGAGRYQ